MKLFLKFIQDDVPNSIEETIILEETTNFKKLRIETLKELFERFNDGQKYDKPKFGISEFCNLKGLKKKKYVAINFKVNCSYWETTSKFFDQVVDIFNGPVANCKTIIVFFWSLIYHENDFLKNKGLTKHEKILLQIKEKLNKEIILPKLEDIEKREVTSWIGKIEGEHKKKTGEDITAELHNLIKKECSLDKKNAFSMLEVQDMFSIIKKKYKILKDE